ncbi:hypothetical protein [Paenibacillus abyssi]|uniref:Uncharacterized protein n=1 Tax=Paenibacillus abyssi TaxID=1340531 RepID=A0A917CKZ1_9BACL|nr:hypothetical protein [Paenibacillus abyssi]GGF92082.1 hypothetical protein GCM10010916_06800 [Paenibacillus abyssi]
MEVLWIILAAIAVIVIIAVLTGGKSRWQPIKSEGPSRTERIDRLQAYLKANGVKSKTGAGAANTLQLKVRKKDVDRAKALVTAYEKEI